MWSSRRARVNTEHGGRESVSSVSLRLLVFMVRFALLLRILEMFGRSSRPGPSKVLCNVSSDACTCTDLNNWCTAVRILAWPSHAGVTITLRRRVSIAGTFEDVIGNNSVDSQATHQEEPSAIKHYV